MFFVQLFFDAPAFLVPTTITGSMTCCHSKPTSSELYLHILQINQANQTTQTPDHLGHQYQTPDYPDHQYPTDQPEPLPVTIL